jgi:DNA-binding NarL/FixJ family response regulator
MSITEEPRLHAKPLPSQAEVAALRVVVIDHETILGTLLCEMARCGSDIRVVGSFSDPAEGERAVARLLPDVLVVDIESADHVDIIARAERLVVQAPRTRVLMLSHLPSTRGVAKVLEGWSYLLKPSINSARGLIDAISRTGHGNQVVCPELFGQPVLAKAVLDSLGPRQRQVLGRMLVGQSNLAIARELGISERSVEWHIAQLYAALNINGLDRGHNARVMATRVFLHVPPGRAARR